jgi:hypothetical protein
MTWWQTAPTFAATILIFFIPGLAVLAAAGVRRFNLLALAAPTSFSIGSVLPVVLDKAKIPFTPIIFIGFSAVLAALILVFRILWLRRRAANGGNPRGVLAFNGAFSRDRVLSWILLAFAVLLPMAIIGYRYLKGFGSPDEFSQTFDNVYHLNAIKFIAETGNGSSLTIGNLTPFSAGFYPAAMHDMMALVYMLTGASVMSVVNVGTVVIGALIWPLACVFLATRIVGRRPLVLLGAGIFSAGFSAFPYLMVGFGVLYSVHSALAILPVALALGIEALGLSRGRPSSFWPPLLALIAVGPGLALSHPSAAIALLVFGAPLVIAKLLRVVVAYRKGSVPLAQPIFWAAFTAGYAIVSLIVWVFIRPSLAYAPWNPFQTNARAIGEILASAPMGTTIAWALLPLTLLGIWAILKQFSRLWWVLGMYLIGGMLYFIVSAWPTGNFRTFWVGVWYNDSFRLAALLPMVTLPVVVIGLDWLIRRISTAAARWRLSDKAAARIPAWASQGLSKSGFAVCLVLVLVLGVISQGGTLSNVQQRLNTIFRTTDSSYLLTTDETQMLYEAAKIVPADEVVVANPRTGGSLIYAFADRKTLAPHIFGDRSPQEQLLLDHWDEAAYNTSVCSAIRDSKAYWALDFGDFEVVPGDQPFIGLRDLSDGSAPGIQLVKSIGKTRLFKVTACG